MAKRINPKIAKAKLINMLKLGAGYTSSGYTHITGKQTFLKNESKPVSSKYFDAEQHFETKKLGFKNLKFEEFEKAGYSSSVVSTGALGVQGATNFIAKVINDSIAKNGLEKTLKRLNSEIQSDRGGIFRIMMAEYQEALNQPDLDITEIKMVAHRFIKSLGLRVTDYKSGGYLAPGVTNLRQDSSNSPDFSIYGGEAEKLIDFLTHVKL